jgi:integrase
MIFPAGLLMKFTAATIKALKLPDGKSETLFFDDDLGGFGVRLRAGGSRNWIFQYKLGTKTRRLTLGPLSAMGLEQARRTATELYARVRLGQDPAGDRVEARAKAGETVEWALKKYLQYRKDHLRPRSFEEVERHLLTHCRPLHKEPLTKIDRRAVATLLNGLPSNANHVRASLSAFFGWAMREGLVDANPVALTNKPSKGGARERVLTPDEIRDIWRGLEQDDYGDIVRLLALSGARRDEIGHLLWSEIDLQAGLIRLPAARVKNNTPFDLPLSGPASTLLEGRARREGRDYVFGRGEGGFSGWSACKRRLDARIDEARKAAGRPPMQPWVLHDLRRTLSTRMHEELGVQPHIVEAVLNHISGHKQGVAGVYNRATYSAEKRQALDMWGERLLSIIEGRASKIIPLRA